MADRGNEAGGSGGRMSGLPIGAGSQFTKGVLLILAAVVLGIVLLQVVDDGKTGPVGAARSSTTSSSTSTTTGKPGKTTTTTGKAAPAKTPAQIRLLVLNAGAPNGSATTVLATLKSHGYTNPANKADSYSGHVVGKQVLCRAGLGREASTLVILLGTKTTKGTLTAPGPPGSAGFDCVALIGPG
jgi:hypothetical protein